MKIFLFIVIIILIIAAIPMIIAIFNLMFVRDITRAKNLTKKDFITLHPEVEITEIESKTGIVGNHAIPPKGDGPEAKEQVLLPDGSFRDGIISFTDEKGEEVFSVLLDDRKIVFNKNEILEYENNKMVTCRKFPEPGVKFTDHATYVNDNYTALIVKPKNYNYDSDRELWLLDYKNLKITDLSKNPHYSSRPPVLLLPEGLKGQLLIYYTGRLSYAFGGDSSRQEYSVLRYFNEKYPGGIDLAKFHFNAGTVYDARMDKEGLVVLCNPSLPAQAFKKDKAVREWRVRSSILEVINTAH